MIRIIEPDIPYDIDLWARSVGESAESLRLAFREHGYEWILARMGPPPLDACLDLKPDLRQGPEA